MKTKNSGISYRLRILFGCLIILLTVTGSPVLLFLFWFFTPNRVNLILLISALLLIVLVGILLLIRNIKWKPWLITLGTAAGVLLAVYVGNCCYQQWEKSIQIDERGVDLGEYEPFASNTKAASLDGPALLQFKKGDSIPRLDGATALYPVYSAFVRATYPQGDYPVWLDNGQVVCTNTVHAWERLIAGETDIIFTAAPSAEQKLLAANAGVQPVLTPIGKEAFVFFVNQSNTVDNLTLDQVRGIYSGAVTNWKEVGGKNTAIRAFQRPESSGSQTALQSLMGDTPIMTPIQQDVAGGMGGIIRRTAAYQNRDNAIGYSFLFYATEMVRDYDIKLLSLNGVTPNRENIRNGSYPASSFFYAVTNGPPDQTEQQLIDWILSAQGQALVDKTGYTPLSE